MEKRKGEDGLKIWKRKVIGHGVLGILLSFVIVGNATGIYGADIDDTVPVEAESEMTDSVKEEQQEITQEKTQDSDDPEPSAEESQEISRGSLLHGRRSRLIMPPAKKSRAFPTAGYP